VDYHLVGFRHVSETNHEVEYNTDASKMRKIDGTYKIRKEMVRTVGPETDPRNRPLIIPAKESLKIWRRRHGM